MGADRQLAALALLFADVEQTHARFQRPSTARA